MAERPIAAGFVRTVTAAGYAGTIIARRNVGPDGEPIDWAMMQQKVKGIRCMRMRT